jgi:hypothetical protein
MISEKEVHKHGFVKLLEVMELEHEKFHKQEI